MEHEQIRIASDKVRGCAIDRDFEEFIVFWVTAHLNRFGDVNRDRRARIVVKKLIALVAGEILVELLAVQHSTQFVEGCE